MKAPKLPSGALWLHEINHDGFRVIARRARDAPSGKQKPQKANLGQKEAGEEKEKRSALSSMGETSRASSPNSIKKELD